MIRPRWYSSRRTFAALIALVTALMSIPVWVSAASADTNFPPVTGSFQASVQTPVGGPTYNYSQTGVPPTTHGPAISAVTDGQTMTFSVNGAVPPNATQSTFSRIRLRECKGGVAVNNISDFDPFTTNKCTSVGLGGGQAFVDSGAHRAGHHEQVRRDQGRVKVTHPTPSPGSTAAPFPASTATRPIPASSSRRCR